MVAQTKTITVVPYPSRPKTPWKVDVPATIAGRRMRRFFPTKTGAKAFAAEFSETVRLRGTQGAAELIDAPTVNEVCGEYLSAKSMTGRNLETAKYCLRKLQAEFGKLRIDLLESDAINAWLSQLELSKTSKATILRNLKVFLNWALKKGRVSRNLSLSLDHIKAGSNREIVTPFEMHLLLRLTKRDAMLRNFVVLGGFAGVRTAEIQKLEHAAIEEAQIFVSRSISKQVEGVGKERFITITDAFRRHYKAGKGRIIRVEKKRFLIYRTALAQRMRRILRRLANRKHPQAANINPDRWKHWPQNCLRHSFASYLFAEKKNAGAVAHEMGHTSEKMVHENYARAVSAAAAKAFWEL